MTSQIAKSPLLAHASKDAASVSPSGEPLAGLPDGVAIHELKTHVDARGSTSEIFDLRWGWHDAPLTSASCVTIRPNKVKGWAYHERFEDRFALLYGDVAMVFYDDREGSSTKGRVISVNLTAHQRAIINVPTHLWHAVHNIGSEDVVLINFPTTLYDHNQPDKFRLPIDTEHIPYRFENAWGE